MSDSIVTEILDHVKNCRFCQLQIELEQAREARDRAHDNGYPGLGEACNGQAGEILEELEGLEPCELFMPVPGDDCDLE